MNKKDMVIQHNDLISGRHNWSTNEIKIVLKAITDISEDNLKVQFKKQDILNLIDDKDLNVREFKGIAKKLGSKIFEIQGEKDGWTILTWFSKIEYNEGIFLIKFNEEMKPYLLNLKKNFTKFNIQNILHMKSNYSMRIYQLLKQYQRIGSRIFNVEDLRNILKVPDTYNYFRLKQIVLLQAQQEMKEHSDITFEFEEIKTGKKITDIKFIINKKEDHKDILKEMKEDNPWYYLKYYGKNVEFGDIPYENITKIIEGEKYLTVKFENGDEIRVKDETGLEKLIIE